MKSLNFLTARRYFLTFFTTDKGTGIDEDDIGLLGVGGKTESGLLERRSHQSRIQLVHLTAKTFNMYAWSTHEQSNIQQLGPKIKLRILHA